MSVDEPNKIDFTSVDKARSRVLLSIADHLDWTENEGEHLLMLQEKLNTYLYFIESGKLVETYSWAKGWPVVIEIAAKYPMNAEATRFFNLAGQRIAELGFTLA